MAREEKPTIPPAPLPPPAPHCEDLMARAREETALPGTPKLDAGRPDVFANVKAEPVIFVRPPELDPEAPTAAKKRAALIGRTKHPWAALERMLPLLRSNPKLARQTVLREGYVFAEDPRLALALYAHLSAHDLFDEPRIWVQRGERKRWAVRNGNRYVWEDGDQLGGPVRLLVFDRVGVEEPGPALHRDLRSLRERLHFDRFKGTHLSERSVIAELRYGTFWVPTLLRSEGARLELECEMVPERSTAQLGLWRDRAARQKRALSSLRQIMLAQIHEGLKFDEPKTEIGQQDGHLRMAWEQAYREGRRKYEFNEDEYRVFGRNGRPAPPQVCVDFLVDTLERASGTWWRPRGEPREKLIGRLSLDPRLRRELRSTRRFIEFAREKTEWFEVHNPRRRERIEIGKLRALTRALRDRADHYAPGDMVVIHGYTPWDEEEQHYHSFFIYESDPVSGFPLTIVGNAGRPTMRVLRTEANRTPKRAIIASIRPRVEWLETILEAPTTDAPLTPAPLVPESTGA